MRVLLPVLLVAGLVGCDGFRDVDGDGTFRVIVIGDSNAKSGGMLRRWPALVGDARPRPCVVRPGGVLCGAMPVEVRSLAQNGATATVPPADYGEVAHAAVQLAAALAARADLVIAAFGTNDLVHLGRDPAEIVAALVGLVTPCRAAGVALVVATTPPATARPGRDDPPVRLETVLRLRAALVATFPLGRRLDFTTGVEPSMYYDPLHLNFRGQQLLRDRVLALLDRR